jgi:hypothetical protein
VRSGAGQRQSGIDKEATLHFDFDVADSLWQAPLPSKS